MISVFNTSNAQVTSKSYGLLLKGLLSESVEFISCDELKEKDEIVILDTRAKQEFEVSKIPGAQWVGFEKFEFPKIQHLDPSQPVVVYCSVGYRSEKIGEKLMNAGFTKVFNLNGGIFEWINQGNQVVDQEGEVTDLIHGYSKTWGIWVTKGEKVYN